MQNLCGIMSDFIFYHENTKHSFPLILFSCFRLPCLSKRSVDPAHRGLVECEAYSSGVGPRGKPGLKPADRTGVLLGFCDWFLKNRITTRLSCQDIIKQRVNKFNNFLILFLMSLFLLLAMSCMLSASSHFPIS